jgi:hypothetical protein
MRGGAYRPRIFQPEGGTLATPLPYRRRSSLVAHLVGVLPVFGSDPERIQRASHRHAGFVQDVRVDHGRFHVSVAEQFLHRPDIVAGFEQVRGERMSQAMGRDPLGQAGLGRGLAYGRLKGPFLNMMTTENPAPRIDRQLPRGEQPLPDPTHPGLGYFVFD